MVRRISTAVVLVAAFTTLGASSGCSLVLDFSDSQIPVDAPPDMPFTEEQCAYKEPNDGLATAAVVVPGTDTGPAAICPTDPEDSDFYKFTVPAGTTSVKVEISFMNRAEGDLDLKLLDAAGTMIAQSRGFADGEVITCPGASPPCMALAEGDYVFQVFPSLGSINSYTFGVTLSP